MYKLWPVLWQGQNFTKLYQEIIIEALNDDNGNVRRLASSALGKLGDQRAIDPLITLLAHEAKPQVRQYAIKALGKIGHSKAQSILEQIIHHKNEKDYNIQAAQSALRNLDRQKLINQSSSGDEIILGAVAKLGGTLGRTGLTQFLTGSKAGWLKPYLEHSYYGQLANLSQKAVLDIVDGLIANGKLDTTGGMRPKVILPSPTPVPQSKTSPTKNPLQEETRSLGESSQASI